MHRCDPVLGVLVIVEGLAGAARQIPEVNGVVYPGVDDVVFDNGFLPTKDLDTGVIELRRLLNDDADHVFAYHDLTISWHKGRFIGVMTKREPRRLLPVGVQAKGKIDHIVLESQMHVLVTVLKPRVSRGGWVT